MFLDVSLMISKSHRAGSMVSKREVSKMFLDDDMSSLG